MDLLETVLRTADAFEHIDKFRKEGIDARSLKLLTDEDLTIIGIEEVAIRKKIIQRAANLQGFSEIRVDIKFDHEYVNTTVSQIVQQMVLYNATLTPLALKDDILNVTVPIANACESLSTAIDDLHQEVVTFKNHVLKEKGLLKPSQGKKEFVISGVLFSVFLVTNIIILRKIVTFFRN